MGSDFSRGVVSAYNSTASIIKDYARPITKGIVKVAALGLVGYVGIQAGSKIADYRLSDLPDQNQVSSVFLKEVKETQYGSVIQKNKNQTFFQRQNNGKFKKLDGVRDEELESLAESEINREKLDLDAKNRELEKMNRDYDSKVKQIESEYKTLEEKARALD